MSRLILRATEYAHLLLAQAVKVGDIVLDGTAGNGHDACFLASLVGEAGHVYAFDIQRKACLATQSLAVELGLAERITVIEDDHANLASYHLPELAAAVFNLGWLPQGDHRLITLAEKTVQALATALTGLRSGGVLVIVAYPGHAGGTEEYEMIQTWLSLLPYGTADVVEIRFPHKERAPIVLFIEKG